MNISLFLKKMLLFLSVPMVFLIPLTAGALRIDILSKELLPLDDMMRIQQNSDCLLQTGIQSTIPWYKFRLANRINLDILAAGSSRMQFFRRGFFKDGVSFANASTAIQNLPSYISFLSALDNAPNILLFDICPWYFNENYPDTEHAKLTGEVYDYRNGYRYYPENIIRRTASMIISGGIHLFEKFKFPENIGLAAVMENTGFNRDGTYIENPQNANNDFDMALRYIEGGRNMFSWKDNDTLCEQSINELERMLQLCRSRGIKAVAILPSFAPAIWQTMMKSGHYHYMLNIFSALKPLFDTYGAELYDFSAGFDDTWTYDGLHPDERASVRMLQLMKEQGSAVGDYLKP